MFSRRSMLRLLGATLFASFSLTSYAFAIVSAAANLRIEQGAIVEARLALGGVAAKPWRARSAEATLVGAAPGPTAFRRAADAALTDAKPSGDNLFKIELARRILDPDEVFGINLRHVGVSPLDMTSMLCYHVHVKYSTL
jgi:hypothetical protein